MLALILPWLAIAHMLGHPFMRYAYLAGTAIALACGVVGYFVVLRGQVFIGDALSHGAFTGALGALVAGVDLLVGLYGACLVLALATAALGARGAFDDTAIGNVFAWVLGLGALFLAVYTSSSRGTNATAGVSVLFGSIFGLSASHALVDSLIALATVVVVLAVARPLLFASIDGAVAAARGVPVGLLSVAFLVLVGVTAGAATQAIGALLLLGLLAAPAGAAQRATARPFLALALAGGYSVAAMWAGLAIAYAAPAVPPSFAIVASASTSYLLTSLVAELVRRRSQRLTASARLAHGEL